MEHRLWHKDLIQVLPTDILVETLEWLKTLAYQLFLTTGGITEPFVGERIQKAKDPAREFLAYAKLINKELVLRGKTEVANLTPIFQYYMGPIEEVNDIDYDDIFYDWHNRRYFWQNYSRLEEMYDCGMIGEDDFYQITRRARMVTYI